MKITLLPQKDEVSGRGDAVSLALAAVVLILNFLDARFTMLMIAHPVWGNIPEEVMEMNPLWQHVIESMGLTSFMIMKTALVMVLLGIVMLSKKCITRIVLSFMAGYYFNLVTIQIAHIVVFYNQVHK